MTDQPVDRQASEPDDGAPAVTEAPLEEVVVPRAREASLETSPRSPLALLGTYAAGFGMGTADVVPGFSGGTVALVVGIYERLVANVRQGARVLSLLVRGRTTPSWQALRAIEWPFVLALLAGVATAIVVLASALHRLLDEQPVAMSATFLGLVLGAALVASREFRASSWAHPVVGLAVAVATFAGLGLRPAGFDDPGLLLLFAAGAVAICAMILPGVSGAFLLLLFGVYEPVVRAVVERDVLALLVFGIGCVAGLAAFSTLLNWLLRSYHDLVLAALIGLMVGSARVLWPWPADEGVGNPTLGAPEGVEVFLAAALALSAFAVVWMVGLAATAATRRLASRR